MIPCTKILKGEGSAHAQKQPGPLFVWNLTSRCNLSCSHCYRDSSSGNKEEGLSDKKCIELAGEIKTLDPPIVLLSGGEPLLRKNIFNIIGECKACGLRVGLSSNGTLIGDKLALKIRQSGIDYVGISIDGKKETHDKLRGKKGAFEASFRALGFLNELQVKTGIRFTLTKANCSDLMDILEKTLDCGCKRFCLYHLVYAGRAGKEMDLRAQDKKICLEVFFKRVKEMALTNPDFEVLTTDNPADAIFLSSFSKENQPAFPCLSPHGGCSAAERIAYLDSSGDVYPCQFLREVSLGNVSEKSLVEIWENKQNSFLRQMRHKKDLLTGKCGSCLHKEICCGCRARAKAYHGSLWADDPACYLEESERENVALSCYS